MSTPNAAPAFKEWAAIVNALLEGEQIVDVRKGGLREDGRHFGLQARRFWLYPTYLHQKPELLKPAYRAAPARTLVDAPADDVVRIPGWAEVVGVATLFAPDQLAALESKFIWALDYAEMRLNWKKRDPLWVLALRVHTLVTPIEVAFDQAYGGCTSWVEVGGLPDDPADVASTPALSDAAFGSRLAGVRDSLSVPLEPPS